jgi:hypothetical protein
VSTDAPTVGVTVLQILELRRAAAAIGDTYTELLEMATRSGARFAGISMRTGTFRYGWPFYPPDTLPARPRALPRRAIDDHQPLVSAWSPGDHQTLSTSLTAELSSSPRDRVLKTDGLPSPSRPPGPDRHASRCRWLIETWAQLIYWGSDGMPTVEFRLCISSRYDG